MVAIYSYSELLVPWVQILVSFNIANAILVLTDSPDTDIHSILLVLILLIVVNSEIPRLKVWILQ